MSIKYYRREIGESGWTECSYEQYIVAMHDPHLDTKTVEDEGVVFTNPDDDLNDLLNLTADYAAGKLEGDAALAWAQALERVQDRMVKVYPEVTLTEDQCYAFEAALQRGFEMVGGNAHVLSCTAVEVHDMLVQATEHAKPFPENLRQAWAISLAGGGVPGSLDERLAFVDQAVLANGKAAKSTPPSREPGEWVESQRIADLPEVDEMLRAFSEDPTNDNAVMIVREVRRLALQGDLAEPAKGEAFDWIYHDLLAKGEVRMAEAARFMLNMYAGAREDATWQAKRRLELQAELDRLKPVYKEGTSLFQIIQDGVARDFQSEQIRQEALASGHVITDELIDAVRRDFDKSMHAFYPARSWGVAVGELSEAMGHPAVGATAPQTTASQLVRLAAERLKGQA